MFFYKRFDMMKIFAVLLLPVLITACNQKGAPPQLWSDQKYLASTADDCAIKGEVILTSLGFTGTVRNGKASYGNFSDNRAALKCVDVTGGSYVFIAVAGADKKEVETLRNKIAQEYR